MDLVVQDGSAMHYVRAELPYASTHQPMMVRTATHHLQLGPLKDSGTWCKDGFDPALKSSSLTGSKAAAGGSLAIRPCTIYVVHQLLTYRFLTESEAACIRSGMLRACREKHMKLGFSVLPQSQHCRERKYPRFAHHMAVSINLGSFLWVPLREEPYHFRPLILETPATGPRSLSDVVEALMLAEVGQPLTEDRLKYPGAGAS